MSHPLDDVRVFDPEGREVRIADQWRTRTAVLVFVRHFGCLFCRQQIAEMRPHLGSIHERGAELCIIGSGSIEEARAFRDEQALDVPLLTDPARNAYRALSMRRGVWGVLRGVIQRMAAARAGGFRQSAVAGDPWQLGGVLIMTAGAAGGVERYRFISRYAGDHPPPEAIVAALHTTS